jgi:putative FmdB family regulatory protein
MPIYEYRCSQCGHQEEHLQKASEPALTKCPACGKDSFNKMLSAAGFQLKGSGWYATDFKGGSAKREKSSEKSAEKSAEKASDAKTESKPDSKPDSPAAKPEAKPETKPKSETPA